jgi:hypothetical protein
MDVCRFAVYNRWGQKVFESSNPLLRRDGKIQGAEQNFGVFVWRYFNLLSCKYVPDPDR